jgi:hypothetical protein
VTGQLADLLSFRRIAGIPFATIWAFGDAASGTYPPLDGLTIFGRGLVDVCVKFHAARRRRARLA